ncbi:MAG TPA: nucleotide sugar dehydrogenase [Candidatus Eremiobacteraceae bacterium]|nr:nucleotide sugar dehydrogenase [Candidatus Eremiobacteraceae bacterium]
MTVTILGLGYIGLPTGSMLALAGHDVNGYDVSADVRARLRAGADHIAELEVRTLVAQALASGKLRIVDDVTPADAFLVCVPTPNASDGRPDLSYVQAAAKAIASHLRGGELIVLESTVPPGTLDRIFVPALRAAGVDPDSVALAHCPERVIPGAIVRELRENSRIIGGRRPQDAQRARELYASFVTGGLFQTDATTAELVKVVENTFRDVNIALANELAVLCEELGVDAWEVIRLANEHPRVNILSPGPGVGGHCIPIDPQFLADAHPFTTELIQTARRVNARMPNHIVRLVRDHVPSGERRKIALLGASYKADVDDSRESPTERLVALFEEHGYEVGVYDPIARGFKHGLSPDLDSAVRDAEAVVLVVNHSVFASIEPERVGALMRGRVLVDARNFFDAEAWRRAGFTVATLGKRAARALGPTYQHATL